MAYLILMLSRSTLLKTLNPSCHGLVLAALSVYALAHEIKAQQRMQIQIAYPKETYLTDQGMLS